MARREYRLFTVFMSGSVLQEVDNSVILEISIGKVSVAYPGHILIDIFVLNLNDVNHVN